MPWYYANNNHRLGPVSDSEFARLAREKIIREDTLVWQHGMPDWKIYADIVTTLPPPEIAPPIIEASAADVAAILAENPAAPRYAGFWIRAAAKLFDWVLLAIVSRQLARVMGLADIDVMQLVQGGMETLEPYTQRLMLLALLDSVMRLAYYWFFLKRYAATPGKLMLGLKVVRADGDPLTHGLIIGRFFSEVLAKYFTLCVGYLVAAFDPEKRAMHDHFCNTRVVKKRRP